MLRRRLDREVQARKQAEHLLEAKSRELFFKSQELERAVAAERQSLHETEILRQALQVFTSKLDFNEIAGHLGDFLENLIPYDAAAIFYSGREDIDLYLLKSSPDTEPFMTAGVRDTTMLHAMHKAKHPVLVGKPGNEPLARKWGFSAQPGKWLVAPMSVGGGHGGGCLIVRSLEADVFSDSKIQLIQVLVSEAAIAFENARLFQEVERLSITDPLTSLSNRRHFDRSSHWEFQRSVRYNFPLTAIMMDIDHFKTVNDSYGHGAGDRVLTRVAAACRQESRLTDLQARYGGEEFCFLLPETIAEEGGYEFAERLRLVIADLDFAADGQNFSITASFGIATRLNTQDNIKDLLERSDQALYQAKQQGRNRTIIWSSSIPAK